MADSTYGILSVSHSHVVWGKNLPIMDGIPKNKTISYMALPSQVDDKVVQHIMLWRTFIGKCNMIMIKGKNYTH